MPTHDDELTDGPICQAAGRAAEILSDARQRYPERDDEIPIEYGLVMEIIKWTWLRGEGECLLGCVTHSLDALDETAEVEINTVH